MGYGRERERVVISFFGAYVVFSLPFYQSATTHTKPPPTHPNADSFYCPPHMPGILGCR